MDERSGSMSPSRPGGGLVAGGGRFRGGYTLAEVLVVVIIVGIAGAVVVPQMLSRGSMGIQAAARTVVADILYVQNEAVSRQAERKIRFDLENNRYWLLDGEDEPLETDWRISGGTASEVNFDQDGRYGGVRLVAAEFDGEPELGFGDMGGPHAGGQVLIEYEDMRYRIRVASFTGRVTVERVEAE